MYATAKSDGLTEAQIVYRICDQCRLPLYQPQDAAAGAQAVVPWLVSQHLISPEWAQYARAATQGSGISDE